MLFAAVKMDSGTIALICTGIGCVAGGVVGLIIALRKAAKIRKHFNIDKGMAYERIISVMGEPFGKVQKGEKLICQWRFPLDGKQSGARIVFVNNTVKTIN
ncbi:MAG: hypothetical protein LBL66_01005 [Clostridiales bacterium]|jgi:hypothetical protein|nr:hypothetical protein [Clostridiales bacterium]